MKIDATSLERMLGELRAAASAAQGGAKGADAAASAGFQNVLAQALDQVNASQLGAERLAASYARGEPGVALQDAMIAVSKAQVSFQAAVQVRNRLVSAYHEIMNMPV